MCGAPGYLGSAGRVDAVNDDNTYDERIKDRVVMMTEKIRRVIRGATLKCCLACKGLPHDHRCPGRPDALCHGGPGCVSIRGRA